MPLPQSEVAIEGRDVRRLHPSRGGGGDLAFLLQPLEQLLHDLNLWFAVAGM